MGEGRRRGERERGRERGEKKGRGRGKRKMDKEVVVLMYNGISLSHEINVIRLVAAR